GRARRAGLRSIACPHRPARTGRRPGPRTARRAAAGWRRWAGSPSLRARAFPPSGPGRCAAGRGDGTSSRVHVQSKRAAAELLGSPRAFAGRRHGSGSMCLGRVVSVAAVLVLIGAGTLAGVASTVAALASLVSYPALLALGLPPVSANVTNTVALVFTGAGAAARARPELAGRAGRPPRRADRARRRGRRSPAAAPPRVGVRGRRAGPDRRRLAAAGRPAEDHGADRPPWRRAQLAAARGAVGRGRLHRLLRG